MFRSLKGDYVNGGIQSTQTHASIIIYVAVKTKNKRTYQETLYYSVYIKQHMNKSQSYKLIGLCRRTTSIGLPVVLSHTQNTTQVVDSMMVYVIIYLSIYLSSYNNYTNTYYNTNIV